jgi:uncharacterized protein (DUF488 family)
MNLYTIGFAQKSAKAFFEILSKNKVARVIDVRVNNKSQLAGFTKGDDLKYFLEKIAGIDYLYMPAYAPPRELMEGYRAGEISWPEYERQYNQILEKVALDKAGLFADACLLCSEPKADACHRRLLAEYIGRQVADVKIIHL